MVNLLYESILPYLDNIFIPEILIKQFKIKICLLNKLLVGIISNNHSKKKKSDSKIINSITNQGQTGLLNSLIILF